MSAHIDRADELVTLHYTAANDEKSWLLAEAQVAATLALVEQQRIANLIAWHGGQGKIPFPLRQQIRKGLGL